ncbi:DivIVA domain-containing protein [Calderihabitans maritimus]|uniref:Septum formation initiator n=1 Tax=Calderihabitans maritimus TaxID=1246530 RepID=A0A1Z5HTK0_9FIRM|nr:DivIVA domain-containing protein [Calderihabitans maritimus]GAW92590.1 septum formation initiator [Calderihabitans maritimus]
MVLTPLDIQEKEFSRSFRGYNEEQVDAFLDRVIKDYEILYKENLELKEQLQALQRELDRYRELEDTLKGAMLMAEQAAREAKKNAEKEADLMFREAQEKANKLIQEAEQRVRQMEAEYRKMVEQARAFRVKFKSFLLSQLELLEEEQENPSKQEVDDEYD